MCLRAGALLDVTWDEPMTGGLRQGARIGTQIRMAIYTYGNLLCAGAGGEHRLVSRADPIVRGAASIPDRP